jgi:hypothetical protein
MSSLFAEPSAHYPLKLLSGVIQGYMGIAKDSVNLDDYPHIPLSG